MSCASVYVKAIASLQLCDPVKAAYEADDVLCNSVKERLIRSLFSCPAQLRQAMYVEATKPNMPAQFRQKVTKPIMFYNNARYVRGRTHASVIRVHHLQFSEATLNK